MATTPTATTTATTTPIPPPPPPPRSLTGCHTCRLRKKKCDEARPVCAACAARAIPCLGYGRAPEWVRGGRAGGAADGGGSGEGELVKIIKKAAERNYRARRRGWRPPAADGLEGMEMMDAGVGMEGVSEEMKRKRTLNDNFEKGVDLATRQLMDVAEGEVMHWGGDLNSKQHYLDADNFSTSSTDGNCLSFRQKSTDHEPTKTSNIMSTSGTASCHSSHTTSSASHSLLSSSGHSSTTCLRPSAPGTISSLWYDSSFAATFSVRSATELDLLTHYLDNVFSLQFGFSSFKPSSPKRGNFVTTGSGLMRTDCTNSGMTDSQAPIASAGPIDRGRGWYLNTLLRCRPFYFATLSISAYHRWLFKTGGVEAAWAPSGKSSGNVFGEEISGSHSGKSLNWEMEKNFLMTLKGLQAVLDEPQMRELRGVELLRARWQLLGTLCQVLSLEVFRTLGGNWLVHVQAARTFLSMIGSSSFSSSTSRSTCRNSKSPNSQQAPEQPRRLDILEQILTDDKTQILTGNDKAALKHFVTSFIWVDILSRASGIHPPPSTTGESISKTFDYLSLLEDHTLDLSRVMGCENWVFIGMAQIVILEQTLTEQRGQFTQARYDPDVLDVASQAAVLEVIFERGIRGLLEARRHMATEINKLELHSNLVTELFALASLMYLHVTVSGAYPWLPQIRAIVSRTVAALCALPVDLLIRVSWPFAVTGCMVLEEKQDVMREVLARAQRAGCNTGTICKGMVVIEECWRLRERMVEIEVSWVNAMESLGEKILLC